MQTELLHLPNSSCTFLQSDKAHEAQTQALVCSLTRAVSQQWSGATPCIALFCHSDLSRTWFVAPTWETAKSNSRADCQAFVNSCLQLSEQDLQSQLRTVSNATKVSAVIYNHNNNLLLQAECLEFKGFKTSRQ